MSHLETFWIMVLFMVVFGLGFLAGIGICAEWLRK